MLAIFTVHIRRLLLLCRSELCSRLWYAATSSVGASVFAGVFLRARDLLLVLLAIPLIPSHIYNANTDNPSQPSPTLTLQDSDNNIE